MPHTCRDPPPPPPDTNSTHNYSSSESVKAGDVVRYTCGGEGDGRHFVYDHGGHQKHFDLRCIRDDIYDYEKVCQ